MKVKLLLFAAVLFFAGCKDSETGPDCSFVSCRPFGLSVHVKYVDKNTNAPLFNTSNTTYKPDDLKITSGSNPNLNIETKISEKDSSVIVVSGIVNGDLVTLGNLVADKFTITSKPSKTECCSSEITSLKINDVTICAPCTDLDERVLIIKK